MSMFRDPVRLIGLGRLSFTALCLGAPRAAAASIGERPADMDSAAATSFAALTGTRAAFLGVMGLATPSMTKVQRRKVLLMLAAVDTVDAVGGLVRARRAGRRTPLIVGVAPGLAVAALQARAATA